MEKNKLFYNNFLDLNHTLAYKIFDKINYPWEVIPLIKDFIIETGKALPKDAFEEVKENVWISKKSKICNTAYIDGPTIIDENADIRHCAFIRGGVIVGKNCVVGNSTEIKNAILFDNVQVPHFNYVGDSVLGYKAHLGAGAIISNVKSDKSNVTVKFEDEKIETGLRKFGAVLGDYVEVGCNSVINPGTIIGRNSNIYPTSMVRGVIGEKMIFKKPGQIIPKI